MEDDYSWIQKLFAGNFGHGHEDIAVNDKDRALDYFLDKLFSDSRFQLLIAEAFGFETATSSGWSGYGIDLI